MRQKIAVVLLNLGGPSSINDIEQYLFNLFYDPAIIALPNPFRYLLAKFISKTRAPKTTTIYQLLGGKSPLLEQTLAQANALEKALNKTDETYRVFVSMRYWHPFSSETAKEVLNFMPDRVLLLPLYPHFCTATSQSSLNDFRNQLKDLNTQSICCYYNHPLFIKAHVTQIENLLAKIAVDKSKIKILFSAHGVPEKIIRKGDPYQWQTEQSAVLIMKSFPNIAYEVCYQSKVGPTKWLGPSSEEAMLKAQKEDYTVIMVPISFVSEHSETLYEIDILFRDYAKEIGLENFYRTSIAQEPSFIDALADIVTNTTSKNKENMVSSAFNKQQCPKQFCCCINREG